MVEWKNSVHMILTYNITFPSFWAEVGVATEHKPGSNYVSSKAYLGKPFSSVYIHNVEETWLGQNILL